MGEEEEEEETLFLDLAFALSRSLSTGRQRAQE